MIAVSTCRDERKIKKILCKPALHKGASRASDRFSGAGESSAREQGRLLDEGKAGRYARPKHGVWLR
ncbi:MAG: hypothetical protein CL583_05540 [Alteromonadaceae bacterium]|uniref:Uncharacterized protein n=1 Tax=Hydrocarboniclastica marina TaxID=2259620 RepID=A0A4P7XCK8_9ALTE|nr:hypothetical protein [Alteromonadaceae bacterium]QCF24578.1 hypothetical protein soil367_00630 [Hydrocarboniclastica marina]